MKIVITGGTGFTGKRVLNFLRNENHEIRCITHDKNNFPIINKFGFEPFLTDINNINDLKKAFLGFEGLINIVSLGFGHAPNIVNGLQEAGIKRALFVSTTAVETKLNAKSKTVRLEAENYIKNSKLDWTILRPTMIYGGNDDRNIIRLIKFLKKFPFVLIPGNGNFLQQPVYVNDVAKAIVSAFFSDKTINKTYNISGAYPISFNQLILEASQALKLKRKIIHLPSKPIILFFKLIEKMFKSPPLKEEQILWLLEDKTFSHETAKIDFGFNPKSFKDGILEEVKSLCLS